VVTGGPFVKHKQNPKQPIRRLPEEKLAAEDFAIDILFEDDFSQFFCIVDDGTGFDALGNRDYLEMVVKKRQGWVIEVPPGTRCLKKGGKDET
jgi:hypothetical protein